MAEPYYYQDNGQTYGPFTPSALKQLANEGVIREETLVRKGEQGAWYQAGTIAGLITPRPAQSEPSFAAGPDAAERARRTFRKAEEQADKVAARLWFLDLKFKQFFTPKLVGALWAVYLCLVILVFVGSVLVDLFTMRIFLAPFAMLVQFVGLIFSVILGRVVLETLLVIFRMSESLENLTPLESLTPLENDGK